MLLQQADHVVQAVVATNFLATSRASTEAFKTANLLKTLSVNALIYGETATGKLTLARYILPNASIFSANDFEKLLEAVDTNSELIITHIENAPNLKRLIDTISASKARVIVTSNDSNLNELLHDSFSVRIYLPPLRERFEDVKPLLELFLQEANKIFGEEKPFEMPAYELDLSQNANSLRKQLFLHYSFTNINENELMAVIEEYLSDKLGSKNDYRNYLHLYEVPLIRAGLKQFKSQLQLAEKLGLNRNTLRKKIAEHARYNLE
ncbi:helix-turn-helix domain-containing protein [Sulfurimonas sp. HSL3-7]|uniref:helix-turn-helix domain-containing protein n=1 Tax=Sulfonitrofixus jiaomeiensis TaxID=3131938 RepID=UPI0031F9BD13